MSSLIEAFFPPRLPALHAVRRRLETHLPSDVAWAALTHLADPIQPAAEIADRLPGRLSAVRRAYALCRSDPNILALVASAHYPHRLRWQAAAATVAEWIEDPTRPVRLLEGDAVISRTVELHPSKGSCNYSCAMCLWSDKKELTYATKDLQAEGLVSTSDWLRILDELHTGGVRTVVFSGGGEVLLNKDVAPVMAHARALGLDTHLYTTGFNVTPGTPLWRQITNLGRIRFSVHSPDPATYDQLVRLSARLQALQRVTANIGALLADRERTGNGPRVGIGFVLQPLNYRQLLDMVAYASEVGVDYLNLRKDEVGVTDGLATGQLRGVAEQLRLIRATAETAATPPPRSTSAMSWSPSPTSSPSPAAAPPSA